MRILLQRNPTTKNYTFGKLTVLDRLNAGLFVCYTLEDELREHKVYAETAIPAGTYRITLIDSPKFGPDSLWIRDVPNFTGILIHGGVSDKNTAGCIIVGSEVDYEKGRIYGGTPKSGARDEGVLPKLKDFVKDAISSGDTVEIEIRNAEGDHYTDTGNVA